jgi:methionyl-tRNA formyltransferase
LRIAFLGTPDFAVPPLDALARAGHEVACVVAQPDRPAGRGKALREPATKAWAREHGLPVLQPEKVRDGRLAAELRTLRPDLLVVVAYGRILGNDLLTLAPHGAVNVHASLLPRWRGAAPIQWALAEGDDETGVTIMQVDEGLDTGDILLQRVLPVVAEDTSETLGRSLAQLGATALVDALELLAGERLVPVRQDPARATLARIIEKEDGRLDFRLPATRLAARIRAFTPWPGAFTTVGGKLLKVHRAQAIDVAPGLTAAPGEPLPSPRWDVACGGDTALRLLEVQLEGKRRMSAEEARRGLGQAPGALGT